MTLREKQLTRFLKSRGFTWLLIIISVMAARAVLPSPEEFIPWRLSGFWSLPLETPRLSPEASWGIAVICCLGVCGLMVLLNRTYNLLRTVSVDFMGYFMLMQVATPGLLTGFNSGLLLAIVVFCCMMLFYSVYTKENSSRRVFLVFFMLTSGAVVAHGFAVFIAVFLIGMRIMRILSMRNIMAACVGMLCPVWILWGFGVIRPLTIILPHMPQLDVFISRSDTLPLTASLTVTLIAGIFFGVANILKIVGLNSRSRDFNWLLSLVGVAAGVSMLLDFNNMTFYATLLNAVTAMQVGLYMQIYSANRAYLALLPLLLAYGGCYVFTILWA